MNNRSPGVRRSLTLLSVSLAALGLASCNEEKTGPDGSLLSTNGNRTLSVMASIRPRVDPNVIAKIHQEKQEELLKQQRALEQSEQQELKDREAARQALDPANRDLPPVGQTAIANNNPVDTTMNAVQQAMNFFGNQPASIPMPPSQPPPAVASYGGYPGVPGSLIPPPPAVTLSTAAAPYPPVDPYAAAYPNPGYVPYPPAVPPQGHPAGSMFSNTSQAPTVAPADEPKKKSLVVITPTGMDPRSPYRQRDDLRLLVRSAFANTSVKELHDGKAVKALTHIDVRLPESSSRGNLSITQRQLDNLFETPNVDPKVSLAVKKIEADTAQSYYRYLAAFNRYTLTQQQISARKQEMDAALDDSERQRAAADLASAQTDADAAKEDLRSAESDLATTAGAQAASKVISSVSGIAPSADQLASSESIAPMPLKDKKSGGHFEFFRSSKDKDKENGKDKDKDKKRHDQPERIAQKEDSSPTQGSSEEPPAQKPKAHSSTEPSSSGISFELKNVETLKSKSVLKVAIRNNTSGSVNIDPDSISVAEGDRKLAEGAIRSEFDSTLVQPNQEVTGTITIFGRPWNDRLTVSLSDQGKPVILRR